MKQQGTIPSSFRRRRLPSTFPDFRGNVCAAFDEDERERQKRAALLLADGANLVVRLAAILGTRTEWAGSKAIDFAEKTFGVYWRDKVQAATEGALWRAHGLATTGLDPKGDREPWDWFNKGVVRASGAVTGFFGLPGAVVDVPLTTMMIMPSVAEIARANYAFMDFYQDMARIHFTLRALERKHGTVSSVRTYFDALVKQARHRKGLQPIFEGM